MTVKKFFLIVIILFFSLISFAQSDSAFYPKIFKAKSNQICTSPDGPNFPGGSLALKKFIEDNFHIPDSLKNKTWEGKLFIQITVDTLGNIHNPKILRGINKSIDDEYLRIFSIMPKWEPKEVKGRKLEDISVYSFKVEISGQEIK